ncbi:hypothetical protein AAFF_G00116800, partial [Aldrovandia affinis]
CQQSDHLPAVGNLLIKSNIQGAASRQSREFHRSHRVDTFLSTAPRWFLDYCNNTSTHPSLPHHQTQGKGGNFAGCIKEEELQPYNG